MSEDSWFFRARGWLNGPGGRWVAVGVVVAALATAAFVFLRDTTGREADEIRSRGRAVLYYCTACGAAGQTRIGYEEDFPVVCPKCGKRQAVMAFRCVKCGRIIQKRNEVVYRCPHPDCRFLYDNRVGPRGPVP